MPTRNNEQHGKPTRLVARIAGPTDAVGAWVERVAEGLIVCAGQRVGQEGWSPSGARMRGAVSKGGGNASLAGEEGGYGDA